MDESRRALLELRIGKMPAEVTRLVTGWVDTAFDGFLVFSHELIESLGLHQEATTEAILADGTRVTLDSYCCYIDGFGEVVAAQVIANKGQLPLIGTELLADRQLSIDYGAGTLLLE